jgi:hypothetical protein
MSAFRARLKAKKHRTTTYDMIIVEESVAEAAEMNLGGAERDLRRAKVNGDESEIAAAEAALEQAKEQVRACYDSLTFRALPSHEFEALISAHEPTKEQQKEGAQWNNDTFSPALLAACCVDSDLSEDEWAEELASWSVADRNAIFSAALSANVTARSLTLPKG